MSAKYNVQEILKLNGATIKRYYDMCLCEHVMEVRSRNQDTKYIVITDDVMAGMSEDDILQKVVDNISWYELPGDDDGTNAQIENNFTSHKLDYSDSSKCDNIRNELKTIASLITELVPDGREKTLALTKLEEVMFWANAGIARKGGLEDE